MSPSPRLAGLVGAVALLTVIVGPALGALAAVALIAAAVVDALAVRSAPRVQRTLPSVLARGVPTRFALTAAEGVGTVRVRQPLPPDLTAAPQEGSGGVEGMVTGVRRGRHVVTAPVARREGPLRLGRWDHRPGGAAVVLVYPDLPTARRLALAVRMGRLREPGLRPRGPLGLGTDFESIRDYAPDDDIRQVNWAATLRTGRPMSNTYRVEQEREVMLLIDAGRLMAAPLQDATRLDVAVDAAVAVAAVADVLGDRCGVLAFAGTRLRHLRPARAGGRAVTEAIFDLEPVAEEADYELAFQTVGGGKRALVMVFTDLIEETAARPLADAVPVLAKRHAVMVASAADDDLLARARAPEATVHGAYAAAAALDVLAARDRAAALLARAGAVVVEAPAASLAARCVSAYLRAKSRARL
ncbi:MAG: hypothetical protein QOF76_4516 [Solirubrobacteraceae bacterium]|nr:hypothetical protein [Solirubrobacteraceae bacterium]